jgi:hypothetical protein
MRGVKKMPSSKVKRENSKRATPKQSMWKVLSDDTLQ